MNRKQRRALKRRGARPSLGSVAASASSGALAELSRAAEAHHRAGAFVEAERHYRQILALFPNHAETHSSLGAALMAQGRMGEALSHYQHVIALKPDMAAAYEEFATAALAAGQRKSAIGAARRALELTETARTRALFAQCIRDARFTADDGRMRGLLLRALAEGWDRPRDLAAACISLIKLDGAVNGCIARANAAWPARLPASDMLGPVMGALSRDQLLCGLLEYGLITDIGLERLLTNVRLAMLTDGGSDEHLLGFCSSLARQCFINQYVFSPTDVEIAAAQRLRASLEQALATGEQCSPFWPIIVGAYFPLHSLSHAEALLARPWPASVAALLAQQIKEPAEERQIAATIPALTPIDGDVSRAVRQQYEESPYPRWVKPGPPGEPIVLAVRSPEQHLDVLIAGCGTGLSAVEFARQTPRARVLAVDLSVASLAYAKRMALSYGLATIECAQADITKLATIGRSFDYIDASGVLHHLADPWEGWRVLLSLLRPAGVMQVGLYSHSARASVVAARALIAERGYGPTVEDIRRCREDVMAAENGSLLRSVIQWNDFFAANECRDLLFHVQEHRATLAEIKAFIAANGLEFTGFMLDAPAFQRFATRFPQPAARTDLDCWRVFEAEAPDTFAGMYQFGVRKPSS